MIDRNIRIAYFLAFFKNTWFWLGIWIIYYLRFTDYAGIGIIETILVVTTTMAEVPTGAVADLFGKKNTLILAFLFETVGAFVMALTPNFELLALSVFIMSIGGAFYSGTIDALIFDTLKQKKQEFVYDKKISNINTISLIAPAICSIFGGFMYKVHPSLPFYGNAFGYLAGLIFSFLLVEPHIDTIKFSLGNYLTQTTKGIEELFKTINIKRQTILLITIGFFVVISSEMLDSFLGFEFGFNATQFGILWSVIFLISAGASQFAPLITRRVRANIAIIIVGVSIALAFMLAPLVGFIFGGILLILLASFEAIFGNLASIVVNRNTESRFRATTLSTFNMIKNIPYILSAFFIGSISSQISAKTTALYLGVLLFILILIQIPKVVSNKDIDIAS